MSRKFDFLKTGKVTSDNLRTQQSESSNVQIIESPRSRGRPAGKRTDPEYNQVTAYIRKSTHHAVKVRLLQEEQGTEFSELVEQLLSAWLQGK